MKIRMFVIAVLATAVAAGAFALSPEHTDWPKGPVQYLMTKEEAAAWKNITLDEQAQNFIDLFWARRDPTPKTAVNEFRDEFDARVKYADEKFGMRGKRGALTDRGKLIVLFGTPTKVERAASAPTPTTSSTAPGGVGSDDAEASQTWRYEGDNATKMFGTPRAEIDLKDRLNIGDFKIERGRVDIGAAQQRVAMAAITQPNLTSAPSFNQTSAAPAAPMAQAVVAAPVPPVQSATPATTEFKTPAFKTAVAEFNAAKTSPYNKPIYVTFGESVTTEGDYFVPVSIYVPKSSGFTAGQGLTFFGVVADANGNPVQVFEQPVTLTATKDDLFVDKSLKLPAGKFRGTFGLAESGKPLTMVSTDMDLAGSIDPAAEGTSRLILSNNIYPMTEAQAPTEPYAYGGLKIVPKSDKTFSQADDLWYFFEVRNPGLGEDKQPKLQTKIEVEGTDSTGKKLKMTSPPSEATASEFKGMTGHWGVGSSIPLASFRPGSYTMSIKVMDTVNKTSYTIKNDFKIVPGAAAAAPPAK